MMTYGNLARITSTAALTGAGAGLTNYGFSAPLSRSEAQALAIGQVAEANIITPRKPRNTLNIQNRPDQTENRNTYTNLGKLGASIALKRTSISTIV
jgi:hypothetical protein